MAILEILFACVSIASLLCAILLINPNIRRTTIIEGGKLSHGGVINKKENNSRLKWRIVGILGYLGWFFLLTGGVYSFLWFIPEGWVNDEGDSVRFGIASLIGIYSTFYLMHVVALLDDGQEEAQRLRKEYCELKKEMENNGT